MNEEAVIKSAKELLRVGILAIVAYLVAKYSILPQTEGTILILAVLKFVDKFLHEFGKEESTKKEDHWAVTGLTRF